MLRGRIKTENVGIDRRTSVMKKGQTYQDRGRTGKDAGARRGAGAGEGRDVKSGQRDGKAGAASVSRGKGRGQGNGPRGKGRGHENGHRGTANSARDGRQKGAGSAAPSASSAIKLQVGQVVPMDVKRLGINGEGIGYVERQVVFVPGALPEERALVRITKVEQRHANGELVSVLKKSPLRVEPPCPVYFECGGCSMQHLKYEGQLEMKRELVRESFARYAKMPNAPIEPTVGMDDPWSYRNKVQLPIVQHQGDVVVGLYKAGSHQIVDVSGCMVQHPKTNRIVQEVREIAKELGISLYDEKTHKGEVRTIVARVGFETGECQLTVVTRTKELSHRKEFVEQVRDRLPEINSIMQNVNPEKTSLIFGDETVALWGKEHIEETLGDVQFSLSPRAFFQLNPEQTVKLYNLVEEAAALTGEEVVVDAYCGVGTIGLWLAKKAKEVHGMDIVPEAIDDAWRNAEKSGIENATFIEGAAEKVLVEWFRKGLQPDVVVVDPPRTGLAPELVQALVKTAPERIVYVSCNPSTLAKDCAVLLDRYEVVKVTPVDMFPQTSHVESVSVLVRKGEDCFTS